jgi:hypothetical protein
MSYIVSVKRVILMSEILGLVRADPTLRIQRQDSETLDLAWSQDSDEGFFQFVQGQLQATSPSTPAAQKLASVAQTLNATVVGEEDLVPQYPGPAAQRVFAGRSTWLGWPILVVGLGALLAWRW